MSSSSQPFTPWSEAQPSTTRGKVRWGGLDGLRGVAVVLVVVFHLWPDIVPGGWLGVGMFFTLSGYLIIGLIDDEVSSTGRLRLGRFMARRIYRLMPAALLTILASLLVAAVLQPHTIRDVRIDALAAVFNVFNWHTAFVDVGYERIFMDTAVSLDHFWSLAIEEQFYLLLPAVVALTRRPLAVFAAMTGVGLLGLVLWWGSEDAYVATPVRFLEIAAGAWLALAQRRCTAVRRLLEWKWKLTASPCSQQISSSGRGCLRELLDKSLGKLRRWLQVLAVLDGGKEEPRRSVVVTMVVLSAFVIGGLAVMRLQHDDPSVFRGVPQLLALCWIVLLASSLPGGPLEQLMSLRLLRWLGTRSYGIYLFHWPIIAFTGWHPLIIIAVSLTTAEVSYQLLEMPVRRQPVNRKMIVILVSAVTLIAAVACAIPMYIMFRYNSIPVYCGKEYPDRWYTVRYDPDFFFLPGWLSCQTDSLEELSGSSLSSQNVPIVTVVGESTGNGVARGLRLWADRTRKMAVVNRTLNGCSPLHSATVTTSWRRPRLIRAPSSTGSHGGSIGGSDDQENCRVHLIEPGTALVLVVDHAFAVVDHKHNNGSLGSILDADFAADLHDVYVS